MNYFLLFSNLNTTSFENKKLHIFFFIFAIAFSQELPPIVKYAPSTYGAGNQNG
jgi:hypothetical protein